MTIPMCRFRHEVAVGDTAIVDDVVRSTGKFNDDELAIARELIDDMIQKRALSDYRVVFAEDGGKVVAYTCYGFIRGSHCRYEIYWIATHASEQGKGYGRAVLAETERVIREQGGVRVYVETSSRDEYHATQAFYRSRGYRQAAFLDGYYHDGDGLLVYSKTLVVQPEAIHVESVGSAAAPVLIAS